MLKISEMVTEIQSADEVIRVVDHLSLELQKGEICALVGESGCGKSMTAFSLMRLLPPSGCIPSGGVTLDSENLTDLPESAMRRIRASKISLIFQEPSTSLNPVMTIGDQILEVIHLHTDLRGERAKQKTLEWLAKVGIPEPERRIHAFPHELSGGQKQRVMIAMALAAEPDFLIADEPTTALDVTVQAQILELLGSLKKSEGIGILLITHDLAVVAQVADRVALMYAGEIVEVAGAEEFFSSPAHPYAGSLLRALPEGKRKGEPLEALPGVHPPLNKPFEGCRFAPRCPRARSQCRTTSVRLEDIGSLTQTCAKEHLVRCLFPEASESKLPIAARFEEPSSGLSENILEVRDYQIRFPLPGSFLKKLRYFEAVRGVSFTVAKGKTTALVGESGSGKTTAARGILQLLRRSADIKGSVRFEGRELGTLSEKALRDIRKDIQVVFQDPFSSLNPRMKIYDTLKEGMASLRPHLTEEEMSAKICETIALCGLRPEALNRYPHEFSGGQRQRIAIARALVLEPKLLICDEPTSALDVSVQAQILNLLCEIQRRTGISYLLITHNFGVVRYMADEVVVMKEGSVVEAGCASEVLNRPSHPYTQNLLSAVPSFDAPARRK